MKKINLIIFSLIIYLLSITNVFAISVKPTGTANTLKGDSVDIYITIERNSNEKKVSAIDGTFNYDTEKFEFISSSVIMEKWTELSNINKKNIFSYGNLSYDNLATSTSSNIAVITLKAKDTARIGESVIEIVNSSATDENGDGISIETGTHTITISSNINTLSSLEIGIKDFKFDKNTLSYQINVPNEIDKLSINASLTDDNSSFIDEFGPRNITLAIGENTFILKIMAQNGEVKTYTLNITRKNIIPSQNDGKGDDNKEEASTGDKKPNNQSGEESNNKDTITTKSSNNYLSYLKLNKGSITFDKTITEYILTVSNDVNEMNLNYKTESDKASVIVEGNKGLQIGKNIILVKVTADDGNIRIYKITVIKKDKDVILSNNSKLKKLIVKDYNFDFNSDIYKYKLKIKKEEILDITYVPEDKNSVVTIIGNNNLKDNSIIKVSVVAENGSSTIYEIKIQKINYWLIIIPLIVAITILLMIYIIRKRNKKNM